eukprot:COSAG02_NODE_33714_length_495_cov_102.704545_1_plen_140_part_01
MLRSAQRLTVSRPGSASARQRTPPLTRVASGGSPPPLRVGCAVLPWMASPARGGSASAGSYPPEAVEPLLRELRGMDEDPRLAAAEVGAAFAARGDCQVLRSAQRLPTLHALFSLSSVVLLASLYPAPVLLWIGNPYILC